MNVHVQSNKKKKSKKSEATKKKRQPLSAKKNNPAATTVIRRVGQRQASKQGKGNYDESKNKSEKGFKGTCHLCGAEGLIVKRISWDCEDAHPYFSFGVKKTDKKKGVDEGKIDIGVRYYWQME